MNNIKINVWRVLTVTVLWSCSVTKFDHKNLEGTYYTKLNGRISLTQNKFAYIDPISTHAPQFSCCDTVAKGTWSVDRNLIILTAEKDSNFFNMNVSELFNNNDTVTFMIKSDLVDSFSVFSTLKDKFIYSVEYKTRNNELKKFSRSTPQNIIQLPKKEVGELESFSITIVPGKDFSGREVGKRYFETIEYNVNNAKANFFEVTIPSLTYQYFTLRRLNKDFVKILREGMLEWDGVIYSKEIYK